MMQFFQRSFACSYDELITFYPRYYRDVREMVAILKAQGKIVDGIMDDIEIVYNDAFIDYMDEAAISRLEKFVGINAGNRTLEERRNILKAYFIGFGHISATLLKEIIKSLAGEDIDVDIVFEPYDEKMNNALYVTMYQDGDMVIDVDTILKFLYKRMPAHLQIVINDTVQIYVDCQTLEQFFFRNLTMTMKSMYFDYKRLDGTWLLDGSVLLDGIKIPLGIEVVNTVRNRIVETETVYLATVRDLWYLDGTYLLDGTKMLGAEAVEEVT